MSDTSEKLVATFEREFPGILQAVRRSVKDVTLVVEDASGRVAQLRRREQTIGTLHFDVFHGYSWYRLEGTSVLGRALNLGNVNPSLSAYKRGENGVITRQDGYRDEVPFP